MGRYVLRYSGDAVDAAKQAVRALPRVHVLEDDGRNLLVEADPPQLRPLMDEPGDWIVTPETGVPGPVTPHPILKRPRRQPSE